MLALLRCLMLALLRLDGGVEGVPFGLDNILEFAEWCNTLQHNYLPRFGLQKRGICLCLLASLVCATVAKIDGRTALLRCKGKEFFTIYTIIVVKFCRISKCDAVDCGFSLD